jgi:hypothetical protein
VNELEVSLTQDEVITQIKQLESNGQSMRKKQIKQTHPDLMRSALHYFPSWQHAIEESEIS